MKNNRHTRWLLCSKEKVFKMDKGVYPWPSTSVLLIASGARMRGNSAVQNRMVLSQPISTKSHLVSLPAHSTLKMNAPLHQHWTVTMSWIQCHQLSFHLSFIFIGSQRSIHFVDARSKRQINHTFPVDTIGNYSN